MHQQVTHIERLPHWLKVSVPGGANFREVKKLIEENSLHTVCQSARCPNVGECWNRRTATFMLLGNVCTRDCAFCAVSSGKPRPPDREEPRRIGDAVSTLQLNYAVVTSVTRDDLDDGGAAVFAEAISEIRRRRPGCKVEVLVPDFRGSSEALHEVMAARPDVLNHNIETVSRLYPEVRSRADYRRSLNLLREAGEYRVMTKSGMMVGMGEERGEVMETMADLREVGCELLTIGQYLQPTKSRRPVARFVRPDEFAELKALGKAMGFVHVESGPLVRSSYHADRQSSGIEGRRACTV